MRDCAGYLLAAALTACRSCIALAGHPAKPNKSLVDKGVLVSTLDRHLPIIQCSVKDVESVKAACKFDGAIVDFIISEIGARPEFVRPLQPQFCKLYELGSTKRPVFINVMAMGVHAKRKPRGALIFMTWSYSPQSDTQLGEQMCSYGYTRGFSGAG